MSNSVQQYLHRLAQCGVLSEEEAESVLRSLDPVPSSEKALVEALIGAGKLTKFQARAFEKGKENSLTLGVYLIKDRIGAGGMGEVYLAEHSRMKREVAIKVLPPQMVRNDSAVQRFHREVQAAAQLHHTNIVTAFDANEDRGHISWRWSM